tara:strand:+ start:3288 stop:4082 length:795 start_codon:yes stop_codon:yes gene_type:complete
MKIHILGSSGMLGRYMETYLGDIYNCISYTRKDFDASKDIYDLEKIPIDKGDIVINCIGVIKPRIKEAGEANTILTNSVFPHLLSQYCKTKKCRLYHITTDCVFSGHKGRYKELDDPDVSDLYGVSKSLGEPEDCCVIRTSILGEEKENKRSFIEWAKSEKGNTVLGFSNHYWNGVTCLELAKMLHRFIEEDIVWLGTRHVFTDKIYTKLEMVRMISEIWGLGLDVTAKAACSDCDRTLRTIHKARYISSDLKTQLLELKDFKL